MIVISQENSNQHNDLITSMYRMRHRVLVEDYGWDEIRKADGVERDVVDHDATVYLIAERESEALGCIRITPSDTLTLSNQVFSDLFDLTPLPVAELIYDSSRIVVTPRLATRASSSTPPATSCAPGMRPVLPSAWSLILGSSKHAI